MSVLTTCQCSRFVPAFQAHEQFTRHILRPYPVTLAGAQRILSKGNTGFAINVTSVQHATIQRK